MPFSTFDVCDRVDSREIFAIDSATDANTKNLGQSMLFYTVHDRKNAAEIAAKFTRV